MWSAQQIKTAHIAKSQLGMHDPQYKLTLVNVAGIRPHQGKVSSKNPSASTAGFCRFMAFCEQSGFIDKNHPAGYWVQSAADQCSGLMRKIQTVHGVGVSSGIWQADSLPAFIQRQTQSRLQGPTDQLTECNAIDLFKIVEGLKAWLFREAKTRGLRVEL